MSFPTIFDWLEQLAFLRGYPAAWIILVTASLIVLYLDWRLSLFALIIQYLTASLLFFDLLSPQLAIIKLFVGMFVCLILYWTARQVDELRAGRPANTETASKLGVQVGGRSVPRDLTMKVIAIGVALLIVAAAEWGFSFYLPGLPADLGYINVAILLLVTLGIAGLVTAGDPLAAGMGVLTFLTGFELYFAAIDQGTRTLAVLAALDFAVALAASYLAQRHYARSLAALNHD